MNQLRWKVVLLCVTGALLSGCHSVKGNLAVLEQLPVRSNDGKMDELPIGQWKTRLDLREWDIGSKGPQKIRMDVKVESTHKKFEIVIPPGITFPSEEGEFGISGQDLNQPFDIRGVVATLDGAPSEPYRNYRRDDFDGSYSEIIAHRVQTTTQISLTFIDPSGPTQVLGELQFSSKKGFREVIERETDVTTEYYGGCCYPTYGCCAPWYCGGWWC